MIQRLEASVHGLVQGVFFRHFTRARAQELKLSGTVSNQPDGTVHVIAEGPQEDIKKLLEWLQQGPELARVDHVDVEWGQSDGQTHEFTILR